MLNALKIDLKPAEIIRAIKKMKKKERETFLENLFYSPYNLRWFKINF